VTRPTDCRRIRPVCTSRLDRPRHPREPTEPSGGAEGSRCRLMSCRDASLRETGRGRVTEDGACRAKRERALGCRG